MNPNSTLTCGYREELPAGPRTGTRQPLVLEPGTVARRHRFDHRWRDARRSGGGQEVLNREWDRLVDQLTRGDCTPFLGAGACVGTLPTGKELSERWADEYKYPFENRTDLADVMQFASVVEKDAVTVKQGVTRYLSDLGKPDFTHAAEPHALLARCPLSVYLTTNYDDFLTQALCREGKDPSTVVCPWYRGANDDAGTRIPREYQPQGDRPLVYHLHGSLRHPSSLVLTERDYSEFLVMLVTETGLDERRIVPTQVLSALTQRPLLFIGYSLRDPSFRTLFHGLVRSVAEVQRRRHISVQLPLPEDLTADARQRAERYVEQYFDDLNISVYWGSAHAFCTELDERLRERDGKPGG